MGTSSSSGASTQVSVVIRAPRRTIYQAFLDADAVAAWLAPDTMTGKIHTFEPDVGGRIHMSLTYTDPADSPGGKTAGDTDTFQGRFVALVPNRKIVWITEFESDDPDFSGEMKITFSLSEVPGGTEVTCLCEDIPPGIRLEDNATGTRQSLQKLADLVE